MPLAQDDGASALPLPYSFLQELASLQERCQQLEVGLNEAQAAKQDLVERLHDADHCRDMAEAKIELLTEALRDKDMVLTEKDGLIQRQNLVLGFALGDGQVRQDDPMHHLWSLATGAPICGRKRRLSEVDV